MLKQCELFDQDERWRREVIERSSINCGISESRVSHYFENEVENRLNQHSMEGLEIFLRNACGMHGELEWAQLD